MKIIPAMDIINGKCVRLARGDYQQKKIYNQQPLEVAKMLEDAGLRFLHLVDLDGARTGRVVHLHIIEQIAANTSLQIDFGGGIRSSADITNVWNAGAMQVTIGSIAAQNKALALSWMQQWGAEKLILGADCNNRKIASNGWQQSEDDDVVSFIQQFEKHGFRQCIVTDIQKDGMLLGPSFPLYREIMQATKMQLIASGGISSMEDLLQLKAIGCAGAIIGKAIYEGNISLTQLSTLC